MPGEQEGVWGLCSGQPGVLSSSAEERTPVSVHSPLSELATGRTLEATSSETDVTPG